MGAPTIDLNTVPGAALTAVLLHPHPDMGGDRFNHVVDTLYRSLPNDGFTTVRFDFSSSDVPTATAEALAAIDECGADRVALVGYSFGAGVAVQIVDPRVLGWALVAPFLRPGDGDGVAGDSRPKHVLIAERDQWCPPSRLQPTIADWANTTSMTLTGADHFLHGSTSQVVDATVAWLRTLAVLPT